MPVRRKYKHLDAGNFSAKAECLHPASYLMFLAVFVNHVGSSSGELL